MNDKKKIDAANQEAAENEPALKDFEKIRDFKTQAEAAADLQSFVDESADQDFNEGARIANINSNEAQAARAMMEYILAVVKKTITETMRERKIPADKEESFFMECTKKLLYDGNPEEATEKITKQVFTNPEEIKAICNKIADKLILPALNSIKPIKAVMNISKVTNEATKLENEKEKELDLGGKKNPIKTIVSLSYDDDNISFIGRPFTGYDRAVYDAICSLYAAGNKGFTAAMVFRAMNGLTETRKINDTQLLKVTASIEKLRHLWIRIDVTDQAKEKGYNNLLSIGKNEYNEMDGRKRVIISDSMLSCKNVIALLESGTQAEAWYFNITPTLYDYSRSINQVLTVEPKYLNVETTSLTDNNIVMRNYIIRRVETMRNPRNKMDIEKIKYDSIYNEIGGFNDPNQKTNKTNRSRAKKNVIAILDDLKTKGLFKNYHEYKIGRNIEGINIIL